MNFFYNKNIYQEKDLCKKYARAKNKFLFIFFYYFFFLVLGVKKMCINFLVTVIFLKKIFFFKKKKFIKKIKKIFF